MLICNLLLATNEKITDEINGVVTCQSSRVEWHGLMNRLDSFEQTWINTPSCEAIYLTGNETIIFWHPSSIYSWKLILQSAFLRKEQSFLYSQLRKPSSVVAERADTSPCKRPDGKDYVEGWFYIKLSVGERVESPSSLLSIPDKDTETLKKVEKGAKGGRIKHFKVTSDSLASQRWCDVMHKATYWLTKKLS